MRKSKQYPTDINEIKPIQGAKKGPILTISTSAHHCRINLKIGYEDKKEIQIGIEHCIRSVERELCQVKTRRDELDSKSN